MRQPRVELARVFLFLRIVGACAIALSWVYVVLILWIVSGMSAFDDEPGHSSTWATVLLLVAVTSFACGALMLLVRPKPLWTPYSFLGALLIIVGLAPMAVVLAP